MNFAYDFVYLNINLLFGSSPQGHAAKDATW